MRVAKSVGFEAAVVFVAGLAVALLANALSPLGLRLDRDYFPRVQAPTTKSPAATNAAAPPSKGGANPVVERLRQRGLQAVDTKAVAESFRDPKYLEGRIVFVDSREDAPYQAWHIPGAWQFDHYHPERHLAEVVPACLVAEHVVVYCQGGDCEDSEFAAVHLHDAGIPLETLHVYVGGLDDWSREKLPLEIGSRGSQRFQEIHR
jgi:rhodanese-related sulfurtransferase